MNKEANAYPLQDGDKQTVIYVSAAPHDRLGNAITVWAPGNGGELIPVARFNSKGEIMLLADKTNAPAKTFFQAGVFSALIIKSFDLHWTKISQLKNPNLN